MIDELEKQIIELENSETYTSAKNNLSNIETLKKELKEYISMLNSKGYTYEQ